jgi:hypothetical protein
MGGCDRERGWQEVDVTSFTNGTITYPPAVISKKPSTYPALTPGTIVSLNYDIETASIDGFVFKPTTGANVFVNIGTPSAALALVLTVGQPVLVSGLLEPPQTCAPTGTISEVDASSLTILTVVYPIGGEGHD